MTQSLKIASVADRSVKALVTAQTALAKVVAELAAGTTATAEVVDAIQQKEAELQGLQSQFDLKFAEQAQALRIRLLENEDKVLAELLSKGKLARISNEDLAELNVVLSTAQADNSKAIEAAVSAKSAQMYSQHNSEMKELKAKHDVESAATAAQVQSQATQITFLQAEVERLRKDIEAERNTRLSIAQAEAGRQGVVVNTGK